MTTLNNAVHRPRLEDSTKLDELSELAYMRAAELVGSVNSREFEGTYERIYEQLCLEAGV